MAESMPRTADQRQSNPSEILRRAILCAAFLGCIVAANYVTSRFGMVPVWFGVTATAGTYFAGVSFIIRDTLQDAAGKRATLAVIVAGAALSAAFSPALALASGAAFLCSETTDFAVYTPLKARGYIKAAVASNVAGALVDTFLFLWLAGFPVWPSVPGQLIGKLAVTGAFVLAVGGARAVLRKPVNAEGA